MNRFTREQMAARVGRDIPNGAYVNLGIGLPTLVANHLPKDREIILHTENGLLGMGPAPEPGAEDPDLINAGKQPVTTLPGASFFHHADSFAMMRGGHLDCCVLGAFQVSIEGDLKQRILFGGSWECQIEDDCFRAGADKAVDCSGAAAAQRLLIDSVRRRGEVAFVGEGGELTLHVSGDMLRKGLTLHGQWHYNLADTPRMMRTIRACGAQLDRLITHRFPMSRVQEAWELQLTGNCGKVLLDPWA